ncbi:Zn-ribbon domain-containing OB-fold protein [Mycolicibacterium sp.]|uniref:Zn-ribbon domain-containing OB-fold protein n=1 Tax=Mycolicibacterium sp. TaxID=2320850 RepID=UPI003D13FB01
MTARYALDTHTAALQQGRLLISVCAACATPQFPPKARCGHCGDTGAPRWIAAKGTGELWSFATFHKAYLPDFDLPTPYVVAVVALDEGVRVYGNVVGRPTAELQVGAAVRARFVIDRCGPPRLTFSLDDEEFDD